RVFTAVPRRRLLERVSASLRLRPRPARGHARSPVCAHEDATGGLVCQLRGGGAPLPQRAPGIPGRLMDRARKETAMPWKENYTISDEKGLLDEEVRWPDGKRCAVLIVVDVSLAESPEGISARDLTTTVAEFATHEGLDLVLAALARRGLKATFAVPAAMAVIHPDKVRRIIDAAHE